MIDLEKIKEIREKVTICNLYMTIGSKRWDQIQRRITFKKLIEICQENNINIVTMKEEEKMLNQKHYAYMQNNWTYIKGEILYRLDMRIYREYIQVLKSGGYFNPVKEIRMVELEEIN